MMGTRCWRAIMLWMAAMGCLAVFCPPVLAATRAWLDRDSVAIDETVTLHIQTDQRDAAPDYAPLRGMFVLGARNASQQMQVANGGVAIQMLYRVVLTPRQAGDLTVPALRVGNERTEPMRLQVVEAVASDAGAAADASTAQGGPDVFVEVHADDLQPYVQQSVGVVVRLYFALALSSGELDLAAPDGGSLQRMGDDVHSTQVIDGRRYTLVERRFLLVPERSGPLTLPPARFKGRSVSSFFDVYFDRGSGELSAHSASTLLQVRAPPVNAAQPWLPLHNLQLRYAAAPQRATAGAATQMVVEAIAQGATQAQFPPLPAPSVAGAQVLAEPAQVEERFAGDVPQLRLTWRYWLVPSRPGVLTVPGLRVAWWDVDAAAPKIARLPDVTLDVALGQGAFAAPAAAVLPSSVAGHPAVQARMRAQATPYPWKWIGLTAGFAVLWLTTLVWVLRARHIRPLAMLPAGADSAGTQPRPCHDLAALRHALDAASDTAGMDDAVAVLCAMAGVTDTDMLAAALDDPAQRAALLCLQRARWSGQGDVPGAWMAFREAFRSGPRWRAKPPEPGCDPVPPLYPPPR